MTWIASLWSSSSLWEHAEYIAEAIVLLGVLVEYLAEFRVLLDRYGGLRVPEVFESTRQVLVMSRAPGVSINECNLDDFTSAAQINDFLSRLLLLLAQDKISTRRAAVLTYITSQLLRTLPAIDKEENAEPTQFIFDLPRPERRESRLQDSSGETTKAPDGVRP